MANQYKELLTTKKHEKIRKKENPLHAFSCLLCLLFSLFLMLSACVKESRTAEAATVPAPPLEPTSADKADAGYVLAFNYAVVPETFELTAKIDGDEIIVSKAREPVAIADLVQGEGAVSWRYPDEHIAVEITALSDELRVSITYEGNGDAAFYFPLVDQLNYSIPFGEGKYFNNDDGHWKWYLNGQAFNARESLSMPFFAGGNDALAAVYALDDGFDSELRFDDGETIRFAVAHEYPRINPMKTKSLSVYITKNNPVAIAKTYLSYVTKHSGIVTLAEKAAANPNVAKLYGAPQVYLFDNSVISEENVRWNRLKSAIDSASTQFDWLSALAAHTEYGNAFAQMLTVIKSADYIDNYQKRVFCQTISELLRRGDFYNTTVFSIHDDTAFSLLVLSRYLLDRELITLNKHALYANIPGLFEPVETWADSRSVDILSAMKNAGIDNAWIGLNDWQQAYSKPELVSRANEFGYLIGPYDSYHSIHAPGEEQWLTSAFDDATLYDAATVENARNEKISGFQGVGRHLNPTLAMSSVIKRVNTIFDNIPDFNSWFVDCDATGEVFNDYSASHITTKQADVAARLARMAYIANERRLVIGSEGGNDFAANTLAFAHGIELPAFSWMDADMNKNRDSDYYLGRYYSTTGGVPEVMLTPTPVKEVYKRIFLDMAYTIPLYKLVYNNVIITSYHWQWATLKIKGEEENRMLYETLYNVPPMYHLDKFEWEKNGQKIAAHVREWANISRQIIHEEMTDFQILSPDRTVQMTEYGYRVQIIANFSERDFSYNDAVIKAKSFIVHIF
jgi:hypothetical protein